MAALTEGLQIAIPLVEKSYIHLNLEESHASRYVAGHGEGKSIRATQEKGSTEGFMDYQCEISDKFGKWVGKHDVSVHPDLLAYFSAMYRKDRSRNVISCEVDITDEHVLVYMSPGWRDEMRREYNID
ncbi:uncharacterized protein PV07_12657 [Cladophialophora immunda]|uniref:Uncharacterized protein n=1 Tax=Cladophialophora immunda TaxID=569365 RepID=A0A0D2BU41_9EURO|nr:uncharacterized protein PV07_12657 [Cladophialophora immunda]KIW21935.1 hypothetical protein PV07_12657 [Cladophialophora immunda]